MAMETREVLKFVAAAQKKPANRLTIKMPLMIMSVQEYDKQDGSGKGYRYQGWDSKSEGIIQFTSSRLLKKGQVEEVLLNLNGFTAYER